MLHAAVDEGLGACFFGVPPDRIAGGPVERTGFPHDQRSRSAWSVSVFPDGSREGHDENVDRRTNWSTEVTGDRDVTARFRDDFGPCRSDRYDSVTGGRAIALADPLTRSSGRHHEPDQGALVRKIIPVVAAGATALAVAGATFGYAALNNDVDAVGRRPDQRGHHDEPDGRRRARRPGHHGRRARRGRSRRSTPRWSTAPGSPCSTAAR